MKRLMPMLLLAGAWPCGSSFAAQPAPPDLTGNWAGATGSTMFASFPSSRDASGNVNAGIFTKEQTEMAQGFAKLLGEDPNGAVRTVPPNGEPPAYKDPANALKADHLYATGATSDALVGCGQPGLPRIGAPNKIVQTPSEIIFLYADLAGMVWRVIPVDGRSFRERVDPSFYGDAVGHWEGDTLVVETRNFIDETWIGEYGYLHSDKMRVIERLRRDGDTLTWQVTVDDPEMLSKPWVKPAVVMRRTSQQIEEPLKCVPTEYAAGHHEQRQP